MRLKIIVAQLILLVLSFFCLLFILIKLKQVLIHLSLLKCDWPSYVTNADNVTSVMVISDIHLRLDNAMDYLENNFRQVLMHSSYTSALSRFNPDYVFVLGDLLDSGAIEDDQSFNEYVLKFKHLFPGSPEKRPKELFVSGNHDIGFHYAMTDLTKSRFDRHFESDSVKLYALNGVNVVAINSMTMDGDFCNLCADADHKLKQIGHQLCPNDSCFPSVRPLVLTHFPLFRVDDSHCGDDSDSGPESYKTHPFVPKWDCLSIEATQLIFETLRPRLVLTGHTHYGCVTKHGNGTYEWTVAPFNYWMTYTPSLLLLKISETSYSINKCLLINSLVLYFFDFLLFVAFIWLWIIRFRRKCSVKRSSSE